MVRSGLRAGSVVWMAAGMVLSVLLVSGASGENWTRFRGPNGQGTSEARGIPTKWSEEDYAWKITLPGGGHSSPVVWGDRVFVTCADGRTRRGILLCLNASDGRELWRKEQELKQYRLNGLNSYASPTPALDGERVYALWPSGEETVLKAFSHGGDEVWTVRLGGVYVRHGHGSSPMVYGDYVIVSHEQERNNEGVTSQWLAIERRTGRVKWRREEPSVENGSYSTPCVFGSEEGRAQLIFTSNAHGVTGVDPETGDVVWSVDSVLPDRVVSSPVIAGDFVLGTCGQGGRGKRLTAVRPARDGADFRAVESYGLETRIVPYVPTSLAYQGLLFAFHDNGVVSCLKSDTGQTLWSEKPAGRFYGSPICVSGVLYCITIDGDVVVLEAGPTYKLLAVNPLGEKSHATPAVGGGRLYLRTVSHLVALGGGG